MTDMSESIALESSTPAPASAPSEALSLRSALEASYDKSVSHQAAPTESAPSAAQAPAATMVSAQPTSAAPAPLETQAPAEGGPPTTAPVTTEVSAPEAPSDIPQRIAKRWTPETWAALPPAVKAEFANYESDIGRLVSRYGQSAQSWSRLEQTVAPYMPLIQAEKGDVYSAVGNLMETARILRQGTPDQKLGLILQTCATFGVPLQRNAQGEIVVPMPSTSADTLSRLNAAERHHLTTTAAADYTARDSVASTLDAYIARPDRPHLQLEGFMAAMAQIISTGQASDLDGAYEAATWLHPQSRAQAILEHNRKEAERLSARSATASAAAVSVPGNSTGKPALNASNLGLRDTLAAALEGQLS